MTKNSSKTTMLTTQRAVAGHTGRHVDVVRKKWVRQLGLRLPISVQDLDHWIAETLPPDKGKESDDPALAVSRRRRERAMAELKEVEAKLAAHKLQLVDDSVVTLEQVDHFLSLFMTELRTMMTRLPEEVASGYSGKMRHSLEEDLKARVELILRAAHSRAEELARVRE